MLQSDSLSLFRFASGPLSIEMKNFERNFDSEYALLSPDQQIVYAHDLSGNLTFLNHAGERLLGYSSEEARRMNVADLMCPEIASRILEQVATAAGRSVGTVYEIEILAKDGRRLKLEVSVHLVLRRDRSIEIEGIAVPATSGTWHRTGRPRCLDENFCNAI